jgi:hypothetical protein
VTNNAVPVHYMFAVEAVAAQRWALLHVPDVQTCVPYSVLQVRK